MWKALSRNLKKKGFTVKKVRKKGVMRVGVRKRGSKN